MNNFQIRKLSQADIERIQSVGRATYEPYYPQNWKPGGLDWYMERCFGTASLLKELADPNIEYFVPTDENGATVGILKLVLLQASPDGSVENALYLEKIYLMPDFFGKGVGQKLMNWVVEKAAGLGREAVWLLVLDSGPVQAYEKAGFKEIGKVRWEFELLKEEKRGGLLMLKKLKFD